MELTRARLYEFLREPGAVFWAFVFPLLLALGLGVAFRARPPEPVRVAVTASHILPLMAAAPGLAIQSAGPPEAAVLLRKAQVDLVVGTSSTGPEIVYRYDPTRAEGRLARLEVDAALQAGAGRKDALAVRNAPVTEPGARYVDFLLPGLVGLNLMGTSMYGVGYAIVAARSRKLMRRFAATPMRRWHYLSSFILSRFLLLVLEVLAIVLFGRLVLDVHVHGSLVDVAAIAGLGALTFAGVALLSAARPESIEAASGWMNLVMLPMWLLSGSFFSSAHFPESVRPFIRALPLTALNDALRAVINDGASLGACGFELAVLAAWGAAAFAIALRIFRWQ